MTNTPTPTPKPHALTNADRRELELEGAETQTPLIALALYSRAPLDAGRAILRLLDSVGLGCAILALLAFHFRREGGVNAAVEAVARWGLTARSSVGSLLPILDSVKDPVGNPTDRRLLELVVRQMLRDATREIYDGPDVVQRLEVADDLVELLDVSIVDARKWWESRQPVQPVTPPEAFEPPSAA